jgi:glycosyltransferase involved in cell wall biosynthesis
LPGHDNSVSIIISTLNEAENIAPLVARIAATAVPFREILFVDNNSTDATRHMIRTLAATHPIRLTKIMQNSDWPPPLCRVRSPLEEKFSS